MVLGDVQFRARAGISDADGEVHWFRAAGTKSPKNYPSGFSIDVPFLASHYEAVKGQPLIFAPSGAGTATLGEGNLATDIVQGISIDIKNKVTTTGADASSFGLKLNSKQGTFSGSFKPAGASKAVKFTGVVFQATNSGAGSFQGDSESGFVRLVPAP